MTKLLDDLAEVVRLDDPACPNYTAALTFIRTHAAEIERNARDEAENQSNVKCAQLIVRDIWETWYPGNEWIPGGNVKTLLNQIFNSLWGVHEFSKTVDARLGAKNAIDTAMREGGGE